MRTNVNKLVCQSQTRGKVSFAGRFICYLLGYVFLSIVPVALTIFSVAAAAQTPQPANVKLSLLAVSKDGIAINDLRKDELAVTVDGKKVDDFSMEFQSRPSIYVLAVDNSGSLRTVFRDVMDGAKSIYAETKVKNLVLPMRFVGRDNIQVAEKFSSDSAFLDSQLNLFFVEAGQTALIDAIYKSVQILAGQNNVSPDYRKAIVVISDGEDRDSYYSTRQLQEIIAKENIQVFFVGLLEFLSKDNGFIGKSPISKSKEFIETVTKESGGFALYPKAKGLADAAKSIGDLLNNEYLLTVKIAGPVAQQPKIEIKLAPNGNRKDVTFRLKTVKSQ